MNDRQKLRQQMRRARRALTPQQQAVAAENLCKRLRQLPDFVKARHIALYLPNDGEIDPTRLIEWCWQQGKTTYLPVLHPIRHNRLWFIRYDRSTRMRRNIYKILEPALQQQPKRPALGLDLVLLPLVAFDAAGGRMGMGGGYYDRTFSFKQTRGLRGPKLVGLAHELQKVEKLPVESWDIPLSGIVTDERRYLV